MKNYYILIYVILFSVGCSNKKAKKCSDTNLPTKISYTQFSKTLDSISSKYKEDYIEFAFTLIKDERFRNIIDNPCTYKTLLIAALKDENKRRVYKLLALYGLQKLCIDDYIDVLEAVRMEYNKGQVDENFLAISINQGSFSLEVSKNYTNERLIQVLKRILPTLKTETNRKLISDILSGHFWKDSREYFRESGEPMPWTCE